MLPRHERKALAQKHGYKTIGEFEEYMTLQKALDSDVQQPYENNLTYPTFSPTTTTTVEEEVSLKPKAKVVEEEDDDASSTDERLEQEMESERINASDKLPTPELLKVGGQILMLPDDMLHRIFDWLPCDAYATLALVSPHWKSFTRTEAVYKRLCERLYLNQSKRRALHVSRFDNSYRVMLEKRPRVRAGGGVYVLKYSKIKPIQRDMWTEVSGKVSQSIKCVSVSHSTKSSHCNCSYRFLSVPYWKQPTIDISTFKRMAESFTLSQLHRPTKCFVAFYAYVSSSMSRILQPSGEPIKCRDERSLYKPNSLGNMFDWN